MTIIESDDWSDFSAAVAEALASGEPVTVLHDGDGTFRAQVGHDDYEPSKPEPAPPSEPAAAAPEPAKPAPTPEPAKPADA